MPRSRLIHFNPPTSDVKTRCGVKLAKVQWTTHKEDVSCNRCLLLIRMDDRD